MTTQVQCLFYCQSVGGDEEQTDITLHATTDGEKWSDFTEFTPSGELTLMVTGNRPARRFFKPGKDYLITIREAEE